MYVFDKTATYIPTVKNVSLEFYYMNIWLSIFKAPLYNKIMNFTYDDIFMTKDIKTHTIKTHSHSYTFKEFNQFRHLIIPLHT